ncbi:hypothetical protein EV178_003625 [Coemansia sp. RSA 1646]|nr:hypothetical protein EV178_003625 [Coemansia sp. RSA 1646]
MADFRMAVLIKNGEDTSCMIAIMDMTSAFVAANCIDLTSNSQVDTSVNYKLRYTPRPDNTIIEVSVNPSDTTIHPNYNSSTLENSVAIMQSSKDTTDNYFAYIASNLYMGDTYNTPVVSNQPSDDSDCAAGSGLYAANKDWMSCTSTITTSDANQACSIPYSLMYRQKSTRTNIVVMSDLYSHSVVYGGDILNLDFIGNKLKHDSKHRYV